MLIHKFARLLSVLAVITLLAASCGGETAIELGAEAEPETQSDAPASSSDATEPTAVPPTSAPEPTAVPTAPTAEPAESAADTEEATDPDQDPTSSSDDGVPFLEDRDDAVAFLVGEGFVPSDAGCLADGAFDVFGTWDFIDLDATSEQDELLDNLLDTCVTTVPGPAAGSAPPGTDPEFDALWIACDQGSASACDDLYFDSPLDSDYEAYGYSCGGRSISESCSVVLGDDSGGVESAPAGSPPPGTDPELDALWVACNDGSAEACEDLFWQSPVDSDYEAYGISCGGRTSSAFCGDLLDG